MQVFYGWQRYAAYRLQLRNTGDDIALVRETVSRRVHWASWLEAMEGSLKMRRAAASFFNRCLYVHMEMWKAFTEECVAEKMAMRRALGRFLNATLAKGFNAFQLYYEYRLRIHEAEYRFTLKRKRHVLYALAGKRYKSMTREDKLRRALGTMLHLKLNAAWVLWADYTEKSKKVSRRGARAVSAPLRMPGRMPVRVSTHR